MMYDELLQRRKADQGRLQTVANKAAGDSDGQAFHSKQPIAEKNGDTRVLSHKRFATDTQVNYYSSADGTDESN